MIISGFETDKGNIRQHNEDSCLTMPKEQIYMVADGVGGHRSGEVASRMAMEQLKEIFSRGELGEIHSQEKIKEYLEDIVDQVNGHIFKLGQSNEDNRGMATTLVLCYLRGTTAYILNIGDSRAYLWRKGGLIQLTEDHTYHNAVIKGIIEEEVLADRGNMEHAIFRALGAEPRVQGDVYEIELDLDDVLLLCTDGLYGELSHEEMESILGQNQTMPMTAKELVTSANLAGGHDNITAICLKITGGDVHGK